MSESGRSKQGKFQPIVPPFIAPVIGGSTEPEDDYGVDNNYPPHFGEVQATATGPEAMESVFATAFSLDAGNTALPGGHFFEENRPLTTFTSVTTLPFGVSGPAGGAGGRPDARVITDWLFYARGFTFGGFTGSTSGSAIVGQPTSYADIAGNTLSSLYVSTMDLPTVPNGSYDDLPYYSPTTRTNNKVLQITGTGSTFAAHFRAAFTDMQFSINYMPAVHSNHTGTSLVVQSLSTENTEPIQPTSGGYDANNVIGGGISPNNAQAINRARDANLDINYPRDDQVFLNASSDLLFLFNYSNEDAPSNGEEYFPVGNVLKCHFPVPVRGVAISTFDTNAVTISTTPTRSNFRGSRVFIEGDFVDGSTFTYIMVPRGGGVPDGGLNNTCGFMSYLALNSREDKHIKNLYISNVWWDPITNGTGVWNSAGGHLPSGVVNYLGPGRFYCGDTGQTGPFQIYQGQFDFPSSGTGPKHFQQDDIGIKINVMPKYNRNFFQVDKRPNGYDGNYGEPDPIGAFRTNVASWNEWRKITKNQIGKTFGKTGSFQHPLDSPASNPPLSLGHGVTFPKGRTGDTIDISMSFMPGGDSVSTNISGATLHNGEIVESFQYQVIKGTTVDGAFIPVWTKSRTL